MKFVLTPKTPAFNLNKDLICIEYPSERELRVFLKEKIEAYIKDYYAYGKEYDKWYKKYAKSKYRKVFVKENPSPEIPSTLLVIEGRMTSISIWVFIMTKLGGDLKYISPVIQKLDKWFESKVN